jgi:hypothetical protein
MTLSGNDSRRDGARLDVVTIRETKRLSPVEVARCARVADIVRFKTLCLESRPQ